MAIDVTVTESCDRCKRKEQVTISSEKLGEFEEKQAKDTENAMKVSTFAEQNAGALPDLVVIFKGEVQMLSNVCDAYCAKTIKNNLEVLFREAKPRKPRQKKEKTAEATEAQAKDKGKNKKKGNAADAAAAAPTE